MNLAHLFILVILSGSILGCEGIDFSNKGCPEKTFGKWCHKCNCKIDCNRENGTCGSQCLEGWHGPNCQMQNIAKNKPTKVREYENSFGQSTVNGDRTDCSFLVNHDKNTMRLRVELEETYNIHGITIFTTKYRTILEKMEGFEVVLSRNASIKAGNVCYDNTQSGKISDSGKIDTSCHGKAKNVFLYHGKKPSYLNICEIEIYVCQTGFWGEQCEYPCECTSSKDQTCDSKTGECPGGCSTDGGCPQVGGMDVISSIPPAGTNFRTSAFIDKLLHETQSSVIYPSKSSVYHKSTDHRLLTDIFHSSSLKTHVTNFPKKHHTSIAADTTLFETTDTHTTVTHRDATRSPTGRYHPDTTLIHTVSTSVYSTSSNITSPTSTNNVASGFVTLHSTSTTSHTPIQSDTDPSIPNVDLESIHSSVRDAFYMSVTALVLLAGMFLSWLMYIIIKSLGIRCWAPVRREHGPYQGRFMEEGHATELTEYEVLDLRQGPKT